MKLFKRILYILRFALGSTLFSIFYAFSSNSGNCVTPNGTVSSAYLVFFIIVVIIFLEVGYTIVRFRSYDVSGNESQIIFKASFFLFDSIYLILASITAFAALYLMFPVIAVDCITGIDALYFSMVTFTTLGYGDLTPSNSFKIIAAGQAVIGYIILGLLVGYAGSLFNTEARK